VSTPPPEIHKDIDDEDEAENLPAAASVPMFVPASNTTMQVKLDSIIASVGDGVCWRDLVQYGETQRHVQGRAISCAAPTLMNIRGSVFWSFEPLCANSEDPSKTLLQSVIWTMLVKEYKLSTTEAESTVANTAWMERVPYKLPYDSDRGKIITKFEAILDNMDTDIKAIHKQVIKSLPNVKAGLVVGKQGIDYFIDKGIVPKHILSQHEDKHLLHPETFVKKNACTDERIFFLNTTSGFLAKLLCIKAQTIAGDDAKLYIHSRPVTCKELDKMVKTSSASEILKQEQARLQKVIEDAARSNLIKQLVDDGVDSKENLSIKTTHDLAAMSLSKLDTLYRTRAVEMPKTSGQWSPVKRSLFEDGVMASWLDQLGGDCS
jgi:hypothetical protein